MTTFTLVIVGVVGFVLGVYVSSQIAEHVDSKKRHKQFLENLEKFDKER